MSIIAGFVSFDTFFHQLHSFMSLYNVRNEFSGRMPCLLNPHRVLFQWRGRHRNGTHIVGNMSASTGPPSKSIHDACVLFCYFHYLICPLHIPTVKTLSAFVPMAGISLSARGRFLGICLLFCVRWQHLFMRRYRPSEILLDGSMDM